MATGQTYEIASGYYTLQEAFEQIRISNNYPTNLNQTGVWVSVTTGRPVFLACNHINNQP